MTTQRVIHLSILLGVVVTGVMIGACVRVSPTPRAIDRWDFTDVPRSIVASSLPLSSVWQFPAPLSIYWTPIVERGTVLVRSQYGLHALDEITGQKRWEYNSERASSGREFPIAVHGNVVATSDVNQIHVLDFESGREIWQQKAIGSRIIFSLAMDNERLYAAGTMGTSQVSAYDIHSGALLWRQDKLVPNSMGEIYVIGDRLYVFSGGRFILNKQTGAIIEQSEQPAFGTRLPEIVSG